jgi:methyltransferase (TIGR00027 family)
VREGQAARTAQTVAFARAIETQRPAADRLFEDRHAVRFLDADGRWMLAALRAPLLRGVLPSCIDWIAPGLLAYAIARTAYIDEALVAALGRGIRQVVILGAGYDTRALRIPGIERARVFEVDHPDTQVVKRARLGDVLAGGADHVRFVDVDFARQELGPRLEAFEFRFDETTVFVWEGVTQYLEARAVEATLDTVARTAPGGELVFTYADRGLIDGSKSFPGGRRLLLAVRMAGEPFRFGLAPEETACYLRARGFELLDDLGGNELGARYFAPRGRPDRATETERVARARIRPPRPGPPAG